MAIELQRYTGSRAARALNWAHLSDDELRREATSAAAARDPERLWALAEAHLTLRSDRNVSTYTLRNYRQGLHVLLEHWQGENLLRPSRHAADRLVLELRSAGLAPGTIQVHLAAARLLYRALRWAGATDAAPLADTRPPKDPTPPEEKRQAYSDAAVATLLEVADDLDRTLVLLGAHGGLRVGEALALTWEDVSLAGGTLRVRAGKGGKGGTVHLSRALSDALTTWKTQSKGAHVLPYRTATRARQRIKNLCRRANVPYLGVHSLRHHCGTRLYRLTGDLRVPAKHLRHASTNTTQTYAKMDTRAVLEAVERL